MIIVVVVTWMIILVVAALVCCGGGGGGGGASVGGTEVIVLISGVTTPGMLCVVVPQFAATCSVTVLVTVTVFSLAGGHAEQEVAAAAMRAVVWLAACTTLVVPCGFAGASGVLFPPLEFPPMEPISRASMAAGSPKGPISMLANKRYTESIEYYPHYQAHP